MWKKITVLILTLFVINSVAKIGIGYSNEGPLPVELTSFSASVDGSLILLVWETATEINNYGFEVQKLSFENPDSTWATLGFVQGHGTTNSPKQYSFADEIDIGIEKVTYRLKQIDIDGKTAYSKMLIVDLSSITGVEEELPTEFSLFQNYPNPFNPTTKIKFGIPQENLSNSSNVTLKLYDLLGSEVSVLLNKNLDSGYYEVELNAESLSSGMYFYQLTWSGKTVTKKLMLIK